MQSRLFKSARLRALLGILVALMPLTAFADFLNVSGDGVTVVSLQPGAETFSVDLGSVCAGSSAQKTIKLAITARSHAEADAIFIFANGSTVSLAVASSTDPALTSTIAPPASIALPANWSTLPDGTLSSSVDSTISLNTSSAGAFAGTLVYSASGVQLANPAVALTKWSSVNVKATIVDCGADVKVVKTAASPSVNVGSTASFSIVVSSLGPNTASNVVLSDVLPSGATWTVSGADATAAGCAGAIPGGNTLTCSFGDLAAGASRTVNVSATTVAAHCPSISNTANVSATNDTNASNNSSSASIDVVCKPDIKVLKTADDSTINRGDTAAFTIVVSNIGTTPAVGVTLSDVLPGGITWNEDSTYCSISAGTLSCSFGDLAAGASKTIHVTGSTAGIQCGTLNNTATVSATNEPSDKVGNNSSSASISIACGEIGTPGFWRNWRNHYTDSQMQTLINYLKVNNAGVYNKDGKNGSADDLTIAKVDAIYDFKDGDSGVSRAQMILAQLTALKLNLAVTQLEGVNGIDRLLPKVCSAGVVNVSSITGATAFFGTATPTIGTEYARVEARWTGKLTTNSEDWSFNVTQTEAGATVIPTLTETNRGTILVSNGC